MLLLGVMAVMAIALPAREQAIGSYVTSLEDRTESQTFNVALACSRLNNTTIPPGATFSFNKRVGNWTADQGYVKAPVSYDGELVRSFGGGVCQASSTLYNAALLAGLEIVQRDRHHFAPRYVPPGRDAAVAYSDIDLKFRNNLGSSVRIEATTENGSVRCSLYSTAPSSARIRVVTRVKSVTKPVEIVQDRTTAASGRRKLVNRGHAGFQVSTYRVFSYSDRTIEQLISEDRYPVLNRIVQIVER